MIARLTVLALLLGAAPPAMAATGQGNWPCIQREVPELSFNTIWLRGDIPEPAKKLVRDPRIQSLAEKLAARRTAWEEAESDIKAFAAAASADRDVRLQGLFLALFDRMSGERGEVMSGIERYGHRQIELAAKLKMDQSAFDRMNGDKATDPAKLSAAQDELKWTLRVFDERQKSLSFVCEVPTIIERRLFALARSIEGQMGGK